MASGFFLGGVSEGIADAEKRALERDRLTQDNSLRTRALDLTEARDKASMGINERAQTLAEKNAARTASREDIARVDKQIAEISAVVGETVKNATAAGRDPEVIKRSVAPLVETASRLAARVGRDPSMFSAQVDAMLTGPTTTEKAAATAEGEAFGKGVGQARAAKALEAAGVDPMGNFKSKDELVKAENALRDDFVKQSGPFIQMRDAKNRLDSLEASGAGDMALIFQFMKMLDPGSTVREGEYATAANSGGIPAAIQGYYNKALGTGAVGKKVRKEILEQANAFYEKQAVQHDKSATVYSNIAKRYKMNPDNVVIDLAPAAAKPKKTGSGDIPPPPPGFNPVP